jgi:hypothetical protein
MFHWIHSGPTLIARFAISWQALALSIAIAAETSPNDLIQSGVPLANGEKLRLPAAQMADGLDHGRQRAVLERICGPSQSLDELLRPSVVAPYILTISNSSLGGEQRIQHIDLAFVAYGDIDKVDRENLLNSHLGEPSRSKSEALSTKQHALDERELLTRHITIVPGELERFTHTQFPVFERVRMGVTLKSSERRADESLTVFVLADPRFSSDAMYSSLWWPLQRDPAGQLTMGAPQPYWGGGGYMKVTQLKDVAEGLFVEGHFQFCEPVAWFQGANLLGAKLPLAIQSHVRLFRRNIAKAK